MMENNNLIYKAIVGSQSYGLNTSTSDTDIKGVYIQPNKYILVSGGYVSHIEVNKDEFYFELRNFLELLAVGNPTAIELLVSPEECVLTNSPAFQQILKYKNVFFTKKLYDSFSGYALNQLKKAQGLEKKFNWEASRIEKKDVIDFCKFMGRDVGKPYTMKEYLSIIDCPQEIIGLTKVGGFRDTYKVYIDHREGKEVYRGIMKEDSNTVRTSVIPKNCSNDWIGFLYFNKEAYSTHCRDYKSYKKWEESRNEARYRESREGKKYDGKNIMHTVRLVKTIENFHHTGIFDIDMSNDREYLLDIKKGNVDLEKTLLDYQKIAFELTNLKSISDLPVEVPQKFISQLEHIIRNKWSK